MDPEAAGDDDGGDDEHGAATGTADDGDELESGAVHEAEQPSANAEQNHDVGGGNDGGGLGDSSTDRNGYRMLRGAEPLTPEEFKKMRPSPEAVIGRRADGSPYLRRPGVDSPNDIVWETVPVPVMRHRPPATSTSAPKRMTLKPPPSGRGNVVKLTVPEDAPKRRSEAR